MDNVEMKEVLIGHLLDVMKYAAEENEKFDGFGVNVQAFTHLETKVWESIKLIVGMPDIEVEGIFVSDIWNSYAYSYVIGEISKREAINRIIDWDLKTDFIN